MADERIVDVIEIDRLVDAWSRRGHRIDPRQLVALNDLLMTLIVRGESLNNVQKTMVAPLFCSTPLEQREFHEVFERWYETLMPVNTMITSAETVTTMLQAAAPKRRFKLPTISRSALLWTLGGGIVAGLFAWMVMNSGAIIPATQINSNLTFYGTFIAFFVFIVWVGGRIWAWTQENQYITRELSKQEPIYNKVPVKGYIQELLPVMQVKPIVSTLRRRTQIPSTEVDVDRTIEKALNNTNWLEIVYRQRKVMPEYVVLIDRKSRFDQQARFVEEVLRKLAADGVWLHQYEFNGDPQICFPLNRKDTPLRLKDLQSRHPDSRLLVFSGTNELVNPLTGLLQGWLESLVYWQERAILTPDKLEKVLLEELETQDFAVLPMTLDGLAALVRAFETDHAPILTSDKDNPPIQLLERPTRWTGRNASPETEVKTLVTDLRNYLDENGFYWLCATAVYPELRWELTLHLGSALNLLNPDTLIRLARLPWFRFGYMPDWIRIALIDGFSEEQEVRVDQVLEKLLSLAYDGPGFELKFGRKAKETLQKMTLRFLNALVRNSPPESPLQDYVFLKFLAKRDLRKLSVRYPNALSQVNIFLEWIRIFTDNVFIDPITLDKVKLKDIYRSLFKWRIVGEKIVVYRKYIFQQSVVLISLSLIAGLGFAQATYLMTGTNPLWLILGLVVYLLAILSRLPGLVKLANDFYRIEDGKITYIYGKNSRVENIEFILIKNILDIGARKPAFYTSSTVFLTATDRQFTMEHMLSPDVVALDINLRRYAYEKTDELKDEIVRISNVIPKSGYKDLDETLAALLPSRTRTTNQKQDGYIVIAYSHKDKEYVRRLQETLQNEGFDVWINDRIDYGVNWSVAIEEKLDQCAALIVIVSGNSYESDWVQSEVDFARRKKKPIFPLLLQGEPWLSIANLQLNDVKNGAMPDEKFFARLARVAARATDTKPARDSNIIVGSSKAINNSRLLKVYLWHANEDKSIVRNLCNQLTSEGWMDVWLDAEKLLPGQEWEVEIEKAITQADVVIACLSSNSVSLKGYIRKELQIALSVADKKPENTIYIIPLRLDICEIPLGLRQIQFLDYFEENSYLRLLTSLQTRAKSLGIATVNRTIIQKFFNIFKSDTEPPDQRNRRILLGHVENAWIKGVLEKSLNGAALLDLEIKEESTDETLPAGLSMLEIFDTIGMGRSLLILGAPGSGKTTMLLELARQLIQRAREDVTEPIPMVFNLSSWTERLSLADWLEQELNNLYSVPRKTAPDWVKGNKLLLLLDGLDEVRQKSRAKCVVAINKFRKEHGLTALVVSSRSQDYTDLKANPSFEGVIKISPYIQKKSLGESPEAQKESEIHEFQTERYDQKHIKYIISVLEKQMIIASGKSFDRLERVRRDLRAWDGVGALPHEKLLRDMNILENAFTPVSGSRRYHPLENSLARIFIGDTRRQKIPCGTGVALPGGRILTCAHVIKIALGLTGDISKKPEQNIFLDFPLSGSTTPITAKVIFWDVKSDIAGLEVLEEFPEGVKPASMYAPDDLWGHSVQTFGFPKNYPEGTWADSKLRGANTNGWIEMVDPQTTGYYNQQGFSGGPVWDADLQGCIGIVVAADMDKAVRTSYLIPTNKIAEKWKDLYTEARVGVKKKKLKVVPALLPYLVGRQEQIKSFNNALGNNRIGIPQVFIIHGNERQSVDMFLHRLVERELPRSLRLSSATNRIQSFNINFPTYIQDENKFIDQFNDHCLRTLAENILADSTASAEEVQDVLSKTFNPVIIQTEFLDDDIAKHINIIDTYLDFWQNWPRLEPRQILIISLAITYRDNNNSRSLSQNRFSSNRIEKLVTNLNASRYPRIAVTVLPKLESISETEARNWARTVAQEYFNGDITTLLSEIRALYEKEESIPMELFASRLSEILLSADE